MQQRPTKPEVNVKTCHVPRCGLVLPVACGGVGVRGSRDMRFYERTKKVALGLIFGTISAVTIIAIYVVVVGDAILRAGKSCGISEFQTQEIAEVFDSIGLCLAVVVIVVWVADVFRAHDVNNEKFEYGSSITLVWMFLTLFLFIVAVLTGFACGTVGWFH